MTDLHTAAKQALEAMQFALHVGFDESSERQIKKGDKAVQQHKNAITALRRALEQPAQQEPPSIKAVAQRAGINLPETYIPTMDDAIAAGDSVLMNEQAALLRECRAALDSLIAQKPTLAGLLCGSTTLGNLKAELGAYRPQGVFGSRPQAREPLTDEQKDAARWRFLVDNSFDKDGVTQFHVWEHSWEPHSQTGEPTEWLQRVRGPALDRFIDRAIEAAHGITGEKNGNR